MRTTGDHMQFEEPHVSDEDLLLSADGELPHGRQALIRDHLEACWECRARLIEIEKNIVKHRGYRITDTRSR